MSMKCVNVRMNDGRTTYTIDQSINEMKARFTYSPQMCLVDAHEKDLGRILINAANIVSITEA